MSVSAENRLSSTNAEASALIERIRENKEAAQFYFPELAADAKRRQFHAGELIYHEGGDVYGAYFIHEGLVKLFNHLPDGNARTVRLHGLGNFVGFECLLHKHYRQAAVAITRVEATYIPLAPVRQLEQRNPQEYCRILKEVYRDLVLADTWIADFSTGSVRARVARLLIFLSTLEYGSGSNRISLLKVQEMADIVGVTQESTSRVLADFKRTKVLVRMAKRGKDLYLINSDKLLDIV